jgi:hypothetical protein
MTRQQVAQLTRPLSESGDGIRPKLDPLISERADVSDCLVIIATPGNGGTGDLEFRGSGREVREVFLELDEAEGRCTNMLKELTA